MWVILICGVDSGVSISASDYYDALIAGTNLLIMQGIICYCERDVVDVISWEKVQ